MSILDQDYLPYHFIEPDEEYTCERCRIARPLDGYDNCGKCQAIIEREEAIEFTQGDT